MVPGRAVLEHGVEDYQQLAHTGGQSQLFRLAGRKQVRVVEISITGLKRLATANVETVASGRDRGSHDTIAPSGDTSARAARGSTVSPGSEQDPVPRPRHYPPDLGGDIAIASPANRSKGAEGRRSGSTKRNVLVQGSREAGEGFPGEWSHPSGGR